MERLSFKISAASFHAPNEQDRAIDVAITLKAAVDDVTFGDTKEGSMGIRMKPQLRLKGQVAKGSALNSEGIVGKAVWGKRSSWISYWAPLGEKEIGISIFDHPPIRATRLGGMRVTMVWSPPILLVCVISRENRRGRETSLSKRVRKSLFVTVFFSTLETPRMRKYQAGISTGRKPVKGWVCPRNPLSQLVGTGGNPT